MKKIYEDAQITVTKFEYEEIMIDIGDGGIPDTETSFPDEVWE